MSTNTPNWEARPRPLHEAMHHLNQAVDDLWWYTNTPTGQRAPRRLITACTHALHAANIMEGNTPLAAWLPTSTPAGSPVRAEAEGAE